MDGFIIRLLVDSVLESLAGLEGSGAGSGDRDLRLGAGVPTGAGGTLLHLEGTKANQRDLVTGDERLGDSLENGVDSLLAVLLGSADHFCNSSDQFSFVHIHPPK